MPYFIQTRWCGGNWHTWAKTPFETPEEALAELERRKMKPDDGCRVVESYTVTRYKPVKVK